MEKKSLYQKLAEIKAEISKAGLKKTGTNKFAGFTYYELADILPAIISLCAKYGVYTYTSYDNELAKLTAVNTDNSEEVLTISSPMKDFELKGCNPIQNLGGVETYSRRYLYLAMFDIVESDAFEATTGTEKNEVKEVKVEKITKQQIEELKSLGTDLNALCTYAGVKKIEDVPRIKAQEAIKLKIKQVSKNK